MSEMIERVGRALAKQEGYAYDPLPYDARARAAIEAMREPTDPMCAAGAKHYHDNYRPGHEREDTNAVEFWHDMIDAALGDK